MGSLFSSPATDAGGEYDYSRPLPEPQEHIARPMSKEALAAIQQYVDDRSSSGVPRYTREVMVASRIRTLIHRAIKHYNSNNKKSHCANLAAGVHFAQPNPIFCTQATRNLCVARKGMKKNSSM